MVLGMRNSVSGLLFLLAITEQSLFHEVQAKIELRGSVGRVKGRRNDSGRQLHGTGSYRTTGYTYSTTENFDSRGGHTHTSKSNKADPNGLGRTSTNDYAGTTPMKKPKTPKSRASEGALGRSSPFADVNTYDMSNVGQTSNAGPTAGFTYSTSNNAAGPKPRGKAGKRFRDGGLGRADPFSALSGGRTSSFHQTSSKAATGGGSTGTSTTGGAYTHAARAKKPKKVARANGTGGRKKEMFGGDARASLGQPRSKATTGARASGNAYADATTSRKNNDPNMGYIQAAKGKTPSSSLLSSQQRIPGASSASSTATGHNNGAYYDPNALMSSEAYSSNLDVETPCGAAEAGAEFMTQSYVTVYYEYEVLAEASRNALLVADAADDNLQGFLAKWMVNCGNNYRRHLSSARQEAVGEQEYHRNMQVTVAPVLGTGKADWDYVLGRGCQSIDAQEDFGQVCYKVLGSTTIYMEDGMPFQANDIYLLTLETVKLAMNFGAMDMDVRNGVLGMHLVQGYDTKPEALMAEHAEVNDRTIPENVDPFYNFGSPNPASRKPAQASRTPGQKFGIAFAILLCIALVVFICVYLCSHRAKIWGDEEWEGDEWLCVCCSRCYEAWTPSTNFQKHQNMDDGKAATPPPFYGKKNAKVDDDESHGYTASLRSFSASPTSMDLGSQHRTRIVGMSALKATPRNNYEYQERGTDDDQWTPQSRIMGVFPSPQSNNIHETRSPREDVDDTVNL